MITSEKNTAKIKNIIDAFSAIGYKRSLIKSDYEYSDFFSKTLGTPKISIGVFGREPLDYRSACFGVDFNDSLSLQSNDSDMFRAFGAPVLFFVRKNKTKYFHNTGNKLIFREEFSTDNLSTIIKDNRNIWNPDEMIRVKSGFKKPSPQQLDFVDIGLLPALEHEASKKIDSAIRKILFSVEKNIKDRKLKFNVREIFQIVFRFLTAKLMLDSGIHGSEKINFSLPLETLNFVSGYYGVSDKPIQPKCSPETLLMISEEISQMFPLKNLSVDTFTYIYEDTFVTEKSRKEMGVHSTPSYIADYVLSQIPLETFPRTKWSFLDPTCGHGIFLIAAMRRMRDLLPSEWSNKKRHDFFVERLHGIEIDAFSVEVARMCLMLADFPESNGWNLLHSDVFSGTNLEKNIERVSFLIGNPPFESMNIKGIDTPKPAHMLQRAMPFMKDGSMIGMILPRSFLDSSNYSKERDTLLKNFHIISLTTLPDKVFLHSDAETTIVVAKKQKKQRVTICRNVNDSHKDQFRSNYDVTWEGSVPQTYFIEHQGGRLILPILKDLWDDISELPRLERFIEIKIGVQYEACEIKNRLQEIVQATPFLDSKPAIYTVTKGFNAYIAKDTMHLSSEKHLRRKRAMGAWETDWDQAKILVPALRTSRGPWRFAAAIDTDKRILSRSFYGIWSKNNISLELICALLNSPISQAYVYAHSFQRNIPIRIYKSIPIPENFKNADLIIKPLVTKYISTLSSSHDIAKDILIQIDAEILKLYNLTPKLERSLLDVFWGDTRRRVPFKFNGFIPPENASFIPLHIYLSNQYQSATPEKILKKIPATPDKNMLNLIDKIWEKIP